jgi:hypothetical protein
MTKTLRLLAVALAAAVAVPAASASAQDAAFGTGTKLINLGLLTDPTGFGGGLEVGLMEFAPNFTLGVGGTFAYQSRSSFGVDVSTTWIVGNANVHFAIPSVPQLDLYSGVQLGIARVSVDATGIGDRSDSDTVFGVNVGGRYMFTPKLGGFAQLGIADAPELFFGVSIKF